MANTYKNTKTLNPALRSIGNMNVRGVVSGGTSDADKAERYGLPVMVSETGYIDSSLLEGGGGGGTTEERVKELINENLQPYNNGSEIKADVETKITSATAEVMISNKLQPYTDGQAIKNEVDTKQTAAQVETAIADKFQPYNDGVEIKADIDGKVSTLELPEAIKEQIQQSTEIRNEITNLVEDVLNPYESGQQIKNAIDEKLTQEQTEAVIADKLQPYNNGVEIENAINVKVATANYDADFAVFSSEQGATKGEKIKNYIDNSTPADVIEKTDLVPYGQVDKTQAGAEIETAIAEKADYVEFETFESEVGDNIGEKIKTYIDAHSGDPTAILQVDMSPYGQTDKTQTGSEIAAAISNAGYNETQIKEFATQQITTETQTGGIIDSAIDAKLGDDLLIQTDLAPYGQNNKTQTGTEIQTALNAKANTSEVVAITDYAADFNNFDAETGDTKGEKIQNYIDDLTDAKVDVTAMAPFEDDPTKIGVSIQNAIISASKTDDEIKMLAEAKIAEDCEVGGTIDDAINAKLTNNLTTSDLSPYGQTDKAQTGADIQTALNLKADAADLSGKVDTTTYDADFANFGESGHTKGEDIANYVNAQGALKVDITAMAPYATEPSQIGTAIQGAISAATKSDAQIKALAEEQIVTDVATNGTIDTAIGNKLTAEKVLRQSDLAPFGENEITEVGADIQIAINAVDAKTKTDQQIKDLADGQITLNAVEPTDMGEFYTDDKTEIGANIKAAILAGGDPTNPNVKQSNLAPYGVADITQIGADIQNGINTAITNAFSPYINGQGIFEEQGAQNANFNSKINDVSNSIVPTIKQEFGVNSFSLSTAALSPQPYGAGLPVAATTYYYASDNSIYYFGQTSDNKCAFCKYKIDSKQVETLNISTSAVNLNYTVGAVLPCVDTPNIVIAISYFGINGGYRQLNSFSTDGGATWTHYSEEVAFFYGTMNGFSNPIYKDAAGNLFTFFGGYNASQNLIKLQIDDPDSSMIVEYKSYGASQANDYTPVLLTNGGQDYLVLNQYYEPKDYEAIKAAMTAGTCFQNQNKKVYIKYKGDYYNYDGGIKYGVLSSYNNSIKIDNMLVQYQGIYLENNAKLIYDWFVCKNLDVDWKNPDTPLRFEPLLPASDTIAGYEVNNDWWDTQNNRAFWYSSNNAFNLLFNVGYKIYGWMAPNPGSGYATNYVPVMLDLSNMTISDWNVDAPTYYSQQYYTGNWVMDTRKNESDFPTTFIAKDYNISTYYIFEVDIISSALDSFKVGDILVTARSPGGNWLECNGSTFTADKYPLLAKIITDLTLPTGTPSWITGGTTTFKAYIKAK